MISGAHASSYLRYSKQKKKGTFLFFIFFFEKEIKQQITINVFFSKATNNKEATDQALLFVDFLR